MRTNKSALVLSTKITNWIILSSVAFGISFCLSLIALRDIGQAFLSGVITIPATYAAVVTIQKRRIAQEKRFRNSLASQIHELEAHKEDLNQYLLDALAEEQEIEASINTLQSELSYLRSQVSEGYNQRKSISWELAGFQEQKQQQATELSFLQTQINTLENQLKELNQALSTKAADIRKAETELNSIKSEIRQLPSQIVELQATKQALEQEILNIQIQKSLLIEEENKTRQSLAFFNLELLQLKAQAKQQNEQQTNNQELLKIREEKRKLEEELKSLKTQNEASPVQVSSRQELLSLPKEWSDFINQLPNYGLKVLKTIVAPNPSMLALKTIAEENLTMPELLIDYINNCALDTIGDRIIEPGSISTPPVIAEEYITLVNQAIDFYES